MYVKKRNVWLAIVTHIGVLIGIVVLVTETNQNQTNSRVSIVQQSPELAVTVYRDISDRDHIAHLMANIADMVRELSLASGLDRLSPAEQGRLLAIVQGVG